MEKELGELIDEFIYWRWRVVVHYRQFTGRLVAKTSCHQCQSSVGTSKCGEARFLRKWWRLTWIPWSSGSHGGSQLPVWRSPGSQPGPAAGNGSRPGTWQRRTPPHCSVSFCLRSLTRLCRICSGNGAGNSSRCCLSSHLQSDYPWRRSSSALSPVNAVLKGTLSGLKRLSFGGFPRGACCLLF